MEDGGQGGGSGHRKRIPCFFKVFFPDFNSEKLSVPPAFWARYMMGEPLGSACSFVGPSGNAWPVHLVKNEAGGMFFETGWKEFAHDHSLSTGDFLLFQYDGNLRFLVMIFDTTTCEKEDAYHVQPSQAMSAAAKSLQKSSDQMAISKKESNKTESSSSSGAQGKTLTSSSKSGSSEGCEAQEVLQRPLRSTRKRENNLVDSGTQKYGVIWVSQRRPVTEEEIERALKRATSFKSRNPCCVLVMRKNSVYYGHRMIIPASDSLYFPKETRTWLTLHGPCGDSWAVTVLRDKLDRSILTAGWRKFSLGNYLEEDDACVFEFIKTDEVRVHIFRVVDKIAPCVRTTRTSRGE